MLNEGWWCQSTAFVRSWHCSYLGVVNQQRNDSCKKKEMMRADICWSHGTHTERKKDPKGVARGLRNGNEW